MVLTYRYKLLLNRKQAEKVEHILCCITKLKLTYFKDLRNKVNLPKSAVDLLKYYESNNLSIADGTDYSALLNAMIGFQKKKDLEDEKPVNSYTTRVSDYLNRNFPIKGNTVYLPKIGRILFKKTRDLPDKSIVLCYCVQKDCLSHYFICIVFENVNKVKEKMSGNNVLGLDYSATHLVIDNNGMTYDLTIPNEKERQAKINRYQRAMTGCKKNSIMYKRYQRQLDKIYLYIKNYRNDYLHKLSTKLADEYDAIVVEDLSMKQLASECHMGKSTNHNAYYEFLTMLEYKLTNKGKRLIKVGRYYPSSKTCSNCGYVYRRLTIDERTWKCPKCNMVHNRDVNAAINIRNEGIRLLGKT